MNKYTLRSYQQKAVDQVELGKKQIIVSPIRSGKSVIMEAITKKYNNSTILILTNSRKILLQLKTYYGEEASFILSGEKMDLSKRIMIGSYQTLTNRKEVDLESFSILMLDEAHRYNNNKLTKQLKEIIPTVVGFSGSPITAKGEKLVGYDKWIRTINIKEMFENNYLSPVKFYSMNNFTEGAESEMKTTQQDFNEATVERIMDGSTLLKNVKTRIIEKQYHLKNKVIMYVSNISMGEKVLKYLDLPNIELIHSKLGNKIVKEYLEWFDKTPSGILINCKMLSEGYDNKDVDGILCLSPTKIKSLFMQRNLRQATYKKDKEGFYDDFAGNLNRFSPYDDDFSMKTKKSCREQCLEFLENTIARHECMKSCTPNTDRFPICNGKISYTMEENPYISDYKVLSGIPCKQGYPMHKFKYSTTTPDNTMGILLKRAECPCGCVTQYKLQTITQPSQAIELYADEVQQNTIMVLYSKEQKQALLIVNDLSKKSHKYLKVKNQQELYLEALKIFKNKKFSILSNIPLNKLKNVKVVPIMNDYVPLINWEKDNQNVAKLIIVYKIEKLIKSYGFKKGMIYHIRGLVQLKNEKQWNLFLDKKPTKQQFMKFKQKMIEER